MGVSYKAQMAKLVEVSTLIENESTIHLQSNLFHYHYNDV